MSQLQVTGEAKIRDIQGPVVANSGVITALDGAASQYVRGDGTLADFPTSTGGGSSVSYYLNSSVSQGTIGGVAYRELSKEPIIGAGTDITISANGYVASYITDANDPDVLSVPGGNFNCEFYFSVNNNTGNPTTYAELYKYDGTTFTLLGSSQAVPESLNQGTTIAPYYFAIPVATAALALTDRLAIRIYVSVDGRVVTLHTENSHLCQVVTTFSKGMVSLNNLTDQSQFITTGTSGTNFNIVSSGDTHTFNLPVASATNTGKLSNTDWSTFNNKVPYTGATANVDLGNNDFTAAGISGIAIEAKLNGTGSSPLILRTGTSVYSFGTNSISLISSPTTANTLIITSNVSSVTKIAQFGLGSLTATRTFTLPDLSGTLALLEGTQTFSGLKTFDAAISANYGIALLNGAIPALTSIYYAALSGNSTGISITYRTGGGTNYTNNLNFPDLNNSYLFPSASGTLALTSDLGAYLPLTGGTLTGALSGTSASFSSTTSATAFIPTGSTIPTNGMYLSAANTLNFATNSLNRFTIASDGIATFGTDLYVNRNIYVNDAESGVYADFYGRNSTSTSTPLAFLYGSAGTVTWNNGGTKMTLTSAGALQLVSSISATSATLNGNVIINSTATALSPLQVVATGTIVRLGEQSGTTGKQFLIGIDATSGRTELQSVWQGTAFTSLALQPSGGNVLIGTTGDNGAKLQVSGAATFSSSVQATNMSIGIAPQTDKLFVYNASGTNTGLTIQQDGTGDIFRANGNGGANRFSITQTGAATFSSSVTANGTITVNEDGAGTKVLTLRSNWAGVDPAINVTTNNSLLLMTNNTERMRITSGGNVGIGTSSPYNFGAGHRTLDVRGETTTSIGAIFTGNSDRSAVLGFYINPGATATVGTSSNHAMQLVTNDIERMRITSGGNVLIGTTTDPGYKFSVYGGGAYSAYINQSGGNANFIPLLINHNVTSGTIKLIVFSVGGTTDVGSITTNGSTTSYNTSSDYRLKQDFKDYNALSLISSIKTYDYQWKNDKSRMHGVIAHELAEILPYAVINEKDGIKEDGTIIPQGVDYSKLVPILVKSIQELEARIKQLENK